jgi:hypothetical protein
VAGGWLCVFRMRSTTLLITMHHHARTMIFVRWRDSDHSKRAKLKKEVPSYVLLAILEARDRIGTSIFVMVYRSPYYTV